MAYATYKSVEVATLHTSLTPCIFDDEPVERDSLSALISDIGYEPIPTGDPEEALRSHPLWTLRLVLASIHMQNSAPFEFLTRAPLRSGVPLIVMTGRLHPGTTLSRPFADGATEFPPQTCPIMPA